MHSNAKEYLLEYAKCQPLQWLRILIYNAIETNGNILQDQLDAIFNAILDVPCQIPPEPVPRAAQPVAPFKFVTLKHISGVNALKDGEIVKFSNSITILYGLNGSGKSGYFRVLNEIVGGNQKKEILPNIYQHEHEPIQVEVEYQQDGRPVSKMGWNGTIRGYPIVSSARVFDSSYLAGFLGPRDADETLVYPLALHLFPYIIQCIDVFRQRLNAKVSEINQSKPQIDYSLMTGNRRGLFVGSNQRWEGDVEEFKALSEFSQSQENLLAETIKKIDELRKLNVADKIKSFEDLDAEYRNLGSRIHQVEHQLKDFSLKATKVMCELAQAQVTNADARSRFEILSQIPSSKTQEWKNFIAAGQAYVARNGQEPNACPYCHQPLESDNAKRLLQAYCEFMNDKTEALLQEKLSAIPVLVTAVESTAIELPIPVSLKNDLVNIHTSKVINAFEAIAVIGQQLQELKLQIITFLQKPESALPPTPEIGKDLKDALNKRVSAIGKEITHLREEEANKLKNINELERQSVCLLEAKDITRQKDQIIKWFSFDNRIRSLNAKSEQLSTRGLTTLSKKAYEELLTQNLCDLFTEELQTLCPGKLNVCLTGTRGVKGVAGTQMVLVNTSQVSSVLSEGEQKAAALALFLAETRMQPTIAPVIFDDPVTSLDHRIAAAFANRLLMLKNQVIIFTHDRLFLSSFETVNGTVGHVCKTIDTACSNQRGKHIRIYQVESAGQNAKGVLGRYRGSTAADFISDATDKLQHYSSGDSTVVSGLIRKAVECLIDELVLRGVTPTRFGNKNNHINWEALQRVGMGKEDIDVLHAIHGRVSGGELHNGVENFGKSSRRRRVTKYGLKAERYI